MARSVDHYQLWSFLFSIETHPTMKPDTQATASLKPVVVGKDVEPTLVATQTVLSDSTSDHFHERRDDIDKLGHHDIADFRNNNRVITDDRPEPSGVMSPTSHADASGIYLTRTDRDEPDDERLGRLNTGEKDLMEYGYDDDDDEFIEAEFETVLQTDVGPKTAAAPDPILKESGTDLDPILMARSAPGTLFSEDEEEHEDQGKAKDDDIHSNQQPPVSGNIRPDFDEAEMEYGEIEVEYIEPESEDYDEIVAAREDVLSDTGNPETNVEKPDGSQPTAALANLDMETEEIPVFSKMVIDEERPSVEDADRNVQDIENAGTDDNVPHHAESNECDTNLADSMISQFSVEERLRDDEVVEETAGCSSVESSDGSELEQQRGQAGLVTFTDTEELGQSLEDKSSESIDTLSEATEGSDTLSEFPEDEKDVKRAAIDEKMTKMDLATHASTILPDATWSFDSALKIKKSARAMADNAPVEVCELAATGEEAEKESQSQEQHNVQLKDTTWSFDSALQMRKTHVSCSDPAMAPLRPTEEELGKEDIPDVLTKTNGDDQRSVLVNAGDSAEMDSHSSSSDGGTVETARDTAVPSDDFDAILESVAEYIENHDWDSFVLAIKARPSLAALSAADFSSVSSEISGFVAVEEDENLLLHEVCKNEPTVEAVSALVSLHETAVKTPGQLGYLPLHIACSHGASVSVVEFLLKAYPQAAESVGIGNMLPIHISCKSGASGDIIKLLLASFPLGSIAFDSYNHTPMYYALSIPEGSEKQELLKSLQLCSENQVKMTQGGKADHDLGSPQKLETEFSMQNEEMHGKKLELTEERSKLSSLLAIIADQETKLSQLKQEMMEERSKSLSIELELKEERSNLSSFLQAIKADQESKLSQLEDELMRERSKVSSVELSLRQECEKLSSVETELRKERSELLITRSQLEEERAKSSFIEQQVKEAEGKMITLHARLDEEQAKLLALNVHLAGERHKSSSLEDKLREELERVDSTERNLQSSLSQLEETKTQLVKEQSTITERFESVQNELAESKVRFLLEKQKLYQKAETQLVEALQIVMETEAKLVNERTQRLFERQELHEKAGRQLVEVSSLVDDAEKELEEEKTKLQEYEDLLERKQKIIDEEQGNYKALLLKFDRANAMNVEKVKQLEKELTAQKAVINSQARQIEAFTNSMSSASDEQNRRLAEETVLIGEIEAKIALKTKLLWECKDIIRVLEQSNAMKSDLLEAQQKKVEALEIGRREKENQLKLHQEATKRLEESIAQKQALEKEEAAKVAKLKATQAARKVALDTEEDQVKELDYSLARKQALIELEQMKEKTLEQTIAQKKELIESEMARIKDLGHVIAEKQLRLMSERNTVQAFEAAVAEKEALLQTEKELTAEIRRTLQEKEELLERTKKTEALVQARTEENERLLALEQKHIDDLKASQAEKESLIVIQKAAVEEVELKLARKESLIKREEYVAKSLERFASRKREIMATGVSSYFVHATANVKFLLKEAYLASGYEKAHIRELSSKKLNSVARNLTGNIYKSLVMKGPKELLSSFVRVFGATRAIESGDEKRFSRDNLV